MLLGLSGLHNHHIGGSLLGRGGVVALLGEEDSSPGWGGG